MSTALWECVTVFPHNTVERVCMCVRSKGARASPSSSSLCSAGKPNLGPEEVTEQTRVQPWWMGHLCETSYCRRANTQKPSSRPTVTWAPRPIHHGVHRTARCAHSHAAWSTAATSTTTVTAEISPTACCSVYIISPAPYCIYRSLSLLLLSSKGCKLVRAIIRSSPPCNVRRF